MAFDMLKIDLVPFSLSDIPTLIAWIPTYEFLVQWTANTFSWPLTHEQLQRHISSANTPESTCRPLKALSPDGSMVGYIELNRIDRENRSGAYPAFLWDRRNCVVRASA